MYGITLIGMILFCMMATVVCYNEFWDALDNCARNVFWWGCAVFSSLTLFFLGVMSYLLIGAN